MPTGIARALLFILGGCIWLGGLIAANGQGPQTLLGRTALVVDVVGVIGPASTRHIGMALDSARQRGAALVVLRIDTPGGLVTSTREIVAAILASPVPVVGYVAPSGGHAASAGMFILMATHVAAMAPGTNVGASTPVDISGVPAVPGGTEKGKDGEKKSASEAKAINDAAAFARSIAELRGRNADWAERAVRAAESASASEALKQGAIDVVAGDLPALLAAISGRSVKAGGRDIVLDSRNLALERVEPGLVTQFLALIANPNVALLLMMIGIYGIIFELATPGHIGPGAVGAVALVLGLYALNQLPFNYTGLALVLIGLVAMAAEAFTPALGLLGAVGLVSFVLGAALLIDTDVPQFQISWTVIAATALASALLLSVVLRFVWRSMRGPAVHGDSDLIGRQGEVTDWAGEQGHVWIHGERWDARGVPDASTGSAVEVVGIDGLKLIVKPCGDTAALGRSKK